MGALGLFGRYGYNAGRVKLDRRRGWFLVACVFCLAAVHAFISTCDHDEIAYLHAGWLVGSGQRPFLDFFEHHHPALSYLLAPVTLLFGDHPRNLVFACRLLDLSLVGVMVLALSRAVSGSSDARDPDRAPWVAILLLGSWYFLRNAIEVRPDPFMTLFAVLALCAWLRHLRERRARHAFLSGFFLGASFVFQQKALIFAALLIMASALVVIRRRTGGAALARSAGLAVLGMFLPITAFAIFLARFGLLSETVFWSYRFNSFYYLQPTVSAFFAGPVVAHAIAEAPVLWCLGLAGMVAAARSFFHSDRSRVDEEGIILAVLTGGLLLALFRSKLPFQHNLLLMLPPLSVLAARQLERMPQSHLRAAVGIVAVLMVVKIAVYAFVYNENRGHENVQARALSLASPGQAVFIAPPFNPISRPDSLYFWYDAPRKTKVYAEYCRANPCVDNKLDRERTLWSTHPPALVYVAPKDPEALPFEWALHQREYEPIDGAGSTGFLRRRSGTTAASAAASPQPVVR